MAVAQPLTHEMEEYIRLSGEIGKEKVCPVSSTAYHFAPSHIFGVEAQVALTRTRSPEFHSCLSLSSVHPIPLPIN